MQKSITFRGKRVRLSPDLPQAVIRWLMGRVHIGTPDSEIESDILDRTKAWPEAVRKQAVIFAMYCLDETRELVNRFRL